MKGTRRTWIIWATFTGAGLLAWAAQDVVRHGAAHCTSRLAWALLWAAVGAIPLAFIFHQATKLRLKFATALAASSAVWILFVCGSMVYFANYPLRADYTFLRDKPYLGEFSPSVPGLLWDVYSFKADPKTVLETARAELKTRGYEEHPDAKSGRTSFVLPAAESKKWSDMEISIYKGKSTGSHGAVLTTGPEADWVTVSLVYPDPLPVPLRKAAGRAGHVFQTGEQ